MRCLFVGEFEAEFGASSHAYRGGVRVRDIPKLWELDEHDCSMVIQYTNNGSAAASVFIELDPAAAHAHGRPIVRASLLNLLADQPPSSGPSGIVHGASIG
jgi:hypothetical protein